MAAQAAWSPGQQMVSAQSALELPGQWDPTAQPRFPKGVPGHAYLLKAATAAVGAAAGRGEERRGGAEVTAADPLTISRATRWARSSHILSLTPLV